MASVILITREQAQNRIAYLDYAMANEVGSQDNETRMQMEEEQYYYEEQLGNLQKQDEETKYAIWAIKLVGEAETFMTSEVDGKVIIQSFGTEQIALDFVKELQPHQEEGLELEVVLIPVEDGNTVSLVPIPREEHWLYTNADTMLKVQQGLRQMADGKVVDL